jgi:hypothetical protein
MPLTGQLAVEPHACLHTESMTEKKICISIAHYASWQSCLCCNRQRHLTPACTQHNIHTTKNAASKQQRNHSWSRHLLQSRKHERCGTTAEPLAYKHPIEADKSAYLAAYLAVCIPGCLHSWLAAYLAGCIPGWLHTWLVAYLAVLSLSAAAAAAGNQAPLSLPHCCFYCCCCCWYYCCH